MKGFLDKEESGWFVCYVAIGDEGTVIKHLPLNRHALQEITELSERLGDLETRIFANPRIDFTIVEECSNYGGAHFGKDCSCKEGFVQYAKINKINAL